MKRITQALLFFGLLIANIFDLIENPYVSIDPSINESNRYVGYILYTQT